MKSEQEKKREKSGRRRENVVQEFMSLYHEREYFVRKKKKRLEENVVRSLIQFECSSSEKSVQVVGEGERVDIYINKFSIEITRERMGSDIINKSLHLHTVACFTRFFPLTFRHIQTLKLNYTAQRARAGLSSQRFHHRHASVLTGKAAARREKTENFFFLFLISPHTPLSCSIS